MSNLASRTFPSLKSLWGYRRRKALATFRVARNSHLVLPIASSFKPNWDLVQRRASGSLVTACKVWLSFTYTVWSPTPFSSDNTHVAVKILTGYATHLNRDHKLRELEVLQRLSSTTPDDSSGHCVRFLAQFIHPGIEEDGEHLCLVTELFWSNVQDFQETLQGGFIAVPTVKQILRHLLLGIARLHKCGIAHTGMLPLLKSYDNDCLSCKLADIKPDNIMIGLGRHWTTDAINNWVMENPPRAYAPERSLNKMVSAYLSQSFPPPTLDELPSCNFKLADFSNGMSSESLLEFLAICDLYSLSAQFVSDQTTDDITPLGLRPPEVVLGGEWNESVDIWTFGCIVSRSYW